MKLDHLLTPHTIINSKWIRGLNVGPETIKIIEENISSKISDIALYNILLDIFPQAKEKKINKWDYIKLKRICVTKENINKIKRQSTEWENISPMHHIRGYIQNL